LLIKWIGEGKKPLGSLTRATVCFNETIFSAINMFFQFPGNVEGKASEEAFRAFSQTIDELSKTAMLAAMPKYYP
jgi:hypothetical protein